MKRSEFFRRACITPPVVIANDDIVTLGVARDLGRKAVPILIAKGTGRTPAANSRYTISEPCTTIFADEAAFLNDLIAIGASLPQRAVLFATYEDHVLALSRNKSRLEDYFILPSLPWEKMQHLASKKAQVELAWRAGVEAPISAFIEDENDVQAAADTVPLPAVLKPSTPHAMLRTAGFKAVTITSRAELEEACERWVKVCPLILQEMIPGEDHEIFISGTYHDAESRCLAIFTGQKIRQHPRNIGVSRLAETKWVEEIAELTLKILAEAHYYGISDVEFKRDPRDGRYKFIEINPRQGLPGNIATAAGINLPYIAYCDAIGRPYAAPRQAEGVRWTNLSTELPSSYKEWRRGELSLTEWLLPLARVRCDVWFSFRDPMPLVHRLVRKT